MSSTVMPRSRLRILTCLGSALALVSLSACSSGVFGDGDEKRVVLSQLPWAGDKANIAVASYLLEHELGYEVEVKKQTEGQAWKALGSGKSDAMLEDWDRPEQKKYVQEERSVVSGGELGLDGKIGWYVPNYLVEKYPGITDWKNLDKYAHLFKTARSGGKGQLLEGEKEFLTNDEAIIKNLGLNYRAVYAGSESAQIGEMKKRAANEQPFLAYWWRPHWMDLEVGMTEVELPPYYAGCEDDPEKIRCGYPEVPLHKYLSDDFSSKGGNAATFLKNFQWSEDDQNEVARLMAVDGLSPDGAAKKWLAENKGTWKIWLWGMGD